MKDINELRNELCTAFEKLRDGTIDRKLMVELNNTAGKIVDACKVEIAHRVLTQDGTPIPFLDTSATPTRNLVERWASKKGPKVTYQPQGD